MRVRWYFFFSFLQKNQECSYIPVITYQVLDADLWHLVPPVPAELFCGTLNVHVDTSNIEEKMYLVPQMGAEFGSWVTVATTPSLWAPGCCVPKGKKAQQHTLSLQLTWRSASQFYSLQMLTAVVVRCKYFSLPHLQHHQHKLFLVVSVITSN